MQRDILKNLAPLINELESHPLYEKIQTLEILQFFMQRHVYAVFDFMSLTKSLQGYFAPINKIWTPPKNRDLARFINEIILGEESDITPDGTFMSHYELYLYAMQEIRTSTEMVEYFVEQIQTKHWSDVVNQAKIPQSAKHFMTDTFNLIEEGSIHKIAAAFCFGREKVIPKIFTALLQKMQIQNSKAPHFYYYLKRHIEVDGENHGPLAMKMMQILCENDENKWQEAESAAIFSINSRLKFWDAVESELNIKP